MKTCVQSQRFNMNNFEEQQPVFYQVLKMMAGQTDLHSVAQIAVEHIRAVTGYSNLIIALPDEDSRHWMIYAASGRLAEMDGQTFSMEQGAIGSALKTGQPQFTTRITDHHLDKTLHPSSRSQLVLPLQYGQRILGAIDLQSDQPNAFEDSDIHVVESLAQAVAVALNNALLHVETSQQTADLNTLYTVSRMINRSLVLEDVLSQALSAVLMSFNFEAGFIALIDPVDNQLRLAVEQGFPSILSRGNQHDELVDTLGAYIHKQGQNLIFEGPHQEIPADLDEAITMLISFGLRAGVCLPLFHQSHMLGVLGCFAHQPRVFLKSRIALLDAIGNQVTTAVSNARLFEGSNKHKFIVNASGELMSLIGQDYTYELVNEAYCLAHAKTQTEIIGNSVAGVWGDHKFQTIIKPHLDKCFAGQEVRYQAWFELPSWGHKHLDVIYSPYYNEDKVTHAVVVSRDITERKQIEEQLFHRAFHDTLTNLPNRILFMEQLEGAIAQAKWNENYLFAVLFIDLDRFKNVNDSLGHLVGDQMLIAIARRLETCVRPNDVVARLGGDEFIILLDNIRDVEEAQKIADRIKQELEIPIDLEGHNIFTTASIGITANTRKYDRPEDLLRDADTAMYEAKANGKARHALFDTGQHSLAVARWQLETDLWQAVKRQEFQLYYQPIISLIDGKLIAVEALLRWQHPQRGLLGPEKFISLAEETGLIVPVGKWLLHTACNQIQHWRAAGQPNLNVTINMSARQLQQPDFLPFIDSVLAESKLPAQALELEITEDIRTQNIDLTILTQLRNKGINISIDDFGIGSSLESLKQFPLTTLKIDQSFVKGMLTDIKDKAIITTIIAMAHSLNLKVIAEGVENKEQLDYLMAQQCDAVQGYLFSQPIPASELAELLEQY